MDEEERRFLDHQEIIALRDDLEVSVVCAGWFAGG
jgi:hypothetical protein